MGQDPDPNPGKQAADLGAAFGRKAGRLVKAARPGLERLAARTRPGVEKAGRDAVQYAREHEDELKQAAIRLARARVTGPFGLVVDAVSRASSEAKSETAALICPHCDAANPTAA